MNTCSDTTLAEVRVSGKTFYVPSLEVCGRTVVVTGKWIKTAQIKDEEVVQGVPVENPKSFLSELKKRKLKVDVFTFTQRPPDITPKDDYQMEWDNWAAIRITTFKEWWEQRLPQESRKNVRRAAKRGVVVKSVPFDDDLVRGIHKIYNEIPIRQGKRFWHFGKDHETVKRSLATYLERSEFIGAYWNDTLIGFLKMVYVNNVAILFHIISMSEHYDKRPMNALIAKAVEVCEQKRVSHFIYGQFIYGNKRKSSLLEFKRRNGFEEITFPKYYIPLTVRGRAFVLLRLYRGIGGLLPEPILRVALACRALCSRMMPVRSIGL